MTATGSAEPGAGQQGPATVANITLQCRAHNLYAGEQDYGAEHISRMMSR